MEDPTGMLAAAAAEQYNAACELSRPSTLYKPTLKRDGNQWHAQYGGEFPEGVSGFGDSPDAAYRDFDKAWRDRVHSTFSIWIDGSELVVTRSEMTGRDVRGLKGIGQERDLWKKAVPRGNDERVGDSQVVQLRAGMEFYSCPQLINGG